MKIQLSRMAIEKTIQTLAEEAVSWEWAYKLQTERTEQLQEYAAGIEQASDQRGFDGVDLQTANVKLQLELEDTYDVSVRRAEQLSALTAELKDATELLEAQGETLAHAREVAMRRYDEIQDLEKRLTGARIKSAALAEAEIRLSAENDSLQNINGAVEEANEQLYEANLELIDENEQLVREIQQLQALVDDFDNREIDNG